MLQKVLGWGSLAIAIIMVIPGSGAIAAGPITLGLVLLLAGLVMGYINQIDDVATRVAYYVLAAVLPTIANSLDVIPGVGGYLNGILDNVAIVIAGVAIMTFCLALWNSLMAAGDDGDSSSTAADDSDSSSTGGGYSSE